MKNPIKNRFDFVLIFDVKDGNPNGDPDAGNLPRIDAETAQGIVTDVCLKRKVRNFVQMTRPGMPGFDIFVKEKGILNQMLDQVYRDLGINLTQVPADPSDGKKRNKEGQGQGSEVGKARGKMCADYYDIRTFGAVMSTGPNAGQVRGPVQLTFARSVDPIVVMEHSITRMAVATEAEAEKQSGDNRTMGRKNTVPYGLYRACGFVSPMLAAQTGFAEDDLELFWQALQQMFEHDRSAARGMMSTRKLIVFKHESALGNALAQELFQRISIQLVMDNKPARDFADYRISIDRNGLPAGIEIMEMV